MEETGRACAGAREGQVLRKPDAVLRLQEPVGGGT